MNLYDAIKDLLLPKVTCLNCGEPRKIDCGAPLCDECLFTLYTHALSDNVCPHCLSPRFGNTACSYCMEGGMEGLIAAYAPFHYHGIVRKLVMHMKFHHLDDAAIPLANEMADCIQGLRFDAMVPVPLHRKRLAERGVNQAELLCSLIALQHPLPILNALVRTRNTKRQTALHHDHRAKNVSDAFRCTVPVEGMNLLLVDDVRTTGSTARACAKELLKAGCVSVSLLTAAVAPPKMAKE